MTRAPNRPDPERVAKAEAATAELAERGVRAIALAMVDPANITRVKCIPLDRLVPAVATGIGISPVFTVALVNDAFARTEDVGGPTGDLRLIPDPDAILALRAMPGWGWSPVDQYTQDGAPWGGCPRSFLRRQVESLRGMGLDLRAAVEHEFFLGTRGAVRLDGSEVEVDPWPAHAGPGYGAEPLTANLGFATDLMDTLSGVDLGLQQFHPEYATGQFEVSVAPRDALGAADTAVAVRQTIRAVARSHGLDVSFAPVVVPDAVGNGAHVHVSLWDTAGELNLFAGGEGPAGMRPKAEAFAAGILRELAALTCVAAPSVVSYGRLQPHRWSGAFAAWGHENRETALRFITGMVGTSGSAANLEIKCVDGAANPYLVIGSLVAAGIAGIADALTLPEGIDEDPGSLTEPEREALGIARLPSSLDQAIHALEGSAILQEALGPMLFDAFLAARRAEAATYADQDPVDVIRAHRWRY